MHTLTARLTAALRRHNSGAAGRVVYIRREPSSLSAHEIRAMSRIVANYFPDVEQMERVARAHLAEAGALRLAMDADRILGFSISSLHRVQTPFRDRPLPLLFQRMLYIDPTCLFRGIGQRLLLGTVTDLLGPLWPFKSFVAVCRTQNPVVAELIGMFSVSYPAYGQPIPAEIRAFAEGLLPLLGARVLDEDFRLEGSLQGFNAADFTDTWTRYFHHDGGPAEQLMLQTAFRQTGDRVLNRGAFVLMIGYARPLRFLGRAIQLLWQSHADLGKAGAPPA